MKLCFDIDGILFPAAAIAEETFITATHLPTGVVREFENKTELWGNWRTKKEGWLGIQNKLSGNDFYKAEDFQIADGQRPRPFRIKGKEGEPDTFLSPLEGAKKVVTDKINEICGKLKTNKYYGYTGRGRVFRHEIATLLEYKGNRSEMKPLIIEELKDWACEAHNITMVFDREADDACSIDTVIGYKKWKENGKQDKDRICQVSFGKDAKGTEGFHFNFTKDTSVRLIEGLGKLWINDKGDVDGEGRMWLYFQVGFSDAADNYYANCFSDVKWGQKSAYKELKDCTTDKMAFEALIRIFKKLYPVKKTVEGCKGSIEIDYLYVMQECFDMAFMLRHSNQPRDRVDVKAVLTKLGVDHE